MQGARNWSSTHRNSHRTARALTPWKAATRQVSGNGGTGPNANAVRRTSQTLHATCYNRPMRLHDYAPRPAHLKWLLDSDPAIRWQVMRDLTGAAPDAIAAERSRVATEGWGAQLLTSQSPTGNWGGGPRGWRDDLPKHDRGMLIALYSLVVLMDLGLAPGSKQA